MAALFLVASGGAAVADDGASLQLRGIAGSGREHTSDAPPQGLMDCPNFAHVCGSFAALVARTANARDIFQEHVVSGLTVFCPGDLAVAAFEQKFNSLSADDQVAVLLHHGAAARYGRDQIAAFEWVAVRTLAADAATNKTLVLAVRDDGDTVSLWPSSGSGTGGAAARVTKAISSDDSTLAVYVVDAVLLPSHLRELLDGGDEAACTPCGGGGYLGRLHCTITVWQGLLLAVVGAVGAVVGVLSASP
ncbi:unnamed protein product [Alopecurus aequalis]